MPILSQQNFLLSYDIADPDRLDRVHRTVKACGIPLQYSVFLVPVNIPGLLDLLGELRTIIDERVDDIRVYPLPKKLEAVHMGRQALPNGVDLVGATPAASGIALLVGESATQ